MTKNKSVIVVGGGAAGLMSAIHSAWSGAEVIIFEKNSRPARKVLITGKGRCNVTNNCSIETVMNNTPTNPKFLYSALNRFSPEDTMSFFEMLGVELKTERGNRVFPVSDKAKDLADALINCAESAGCSIYEKNI
ncbi:MAG: NAD(P)/FAD-dependent oxidoreductase, partial [Pseudoruminococcus massiliensis]